MKKYIFIGLFGFISLWVTAQQQTDEQVNDTTGYEDKASYLTISGIIGTSPLDYKLNSLNEKGNTSSSLGYGFELKYSYYWNKHWGVTSGIGFSHSSTRGKLKGSLEPENYYSLGRYTDNDWREAPKDFELKARITNLEEKQSVWFIDIPVMLSYQTYLGEEQRWGIYGGLGAKLRIPVTAKYRIQNGSQSQFNVSGGYDGIPTDMGGPGEPPVPSHGYGTITDPNSIHDWDDKIKLKMGISATAELGFMVDLGKGIDLMIGGYADYGLNNLKKKGKQNLFEFPHDVYHPNADSRVGQNIEYNGMLNSNATGKIKMISFGGKLSLRFML